MAKHVILGHEHKPHHKEAWQVDLAGLVVILVACHAVAFFFWAWLLYKSRKANATGVSKGVKWGGARSSSPARRSGGGAAGAAGVFGWRTPREVLVQHRSKVLGKV
ncbi:hypothetical protein TSOC_004267 [Tetrabaena socialis]|uniref:Uncharacterized protein n=1 Tax=Tetrabaena socialis TaxID=47790 RepID=A0A2J8A9G7_9CHLO|nr:hypothetical protein TSOC_004267 [Tetrabaena socialis]|eukprot:PNH09145.1 hypothetical protein TSOC_004267 [Tetrabaena socialis]